jgi:hypothetical protein
MMRKGKGVFRGIAVVALAAAAGCASKKPMTALEKVTADQKAYVESGKKIEKAQKELEAFQNTLKDLQGSFKPDTGLTSVDDAARTLGRLSITVQKAQLDLNEVRNENKQAMQDFDWRLEDAASPRPARGTAE